MRRARFSSYSTHVTAPCDGDLAFEIYRESVFQKISKRMGFQDVRVGDAEYDRTFMVKARKPDVIRKRCVRSFRKRHLENPNVHISAESGTLRIVRGDLVSDFDESLHLLEFAAVAAETFASP